jgi:hypothetical protein
LGGVQVQDWVDAEGVEGGCPVDLVGVSAVGDHLPHSLPTIDQGADGRKDRGHAVGGGRDDDDPFSDAGCLGRGLAGLSDADEGVEFVAEVGLRLAGLGGLHSPLGIRIRGQFVAALAA